MSFFHLEPPPLDSDIPPPLDDKLKDNNYYDLDVDEDIIIEDSVISSNLPELPTDYNVFSSAATDETFYPSKPPTITSPIVFCATIPPDDEDPYRSVSSISSTKSKTPEKHDVAKEKESDAINELVPPIPIGGHLSVGASKLDATELCDDDDTVNKESIVPIVTNGIDNTENSSTNVSVISRSQSDENIPFKADFNPPENLRNKEDLEKTKEEIIVEQSSEEFDDDFDEFVEATPVHDNFIEKDIEFDDFTGIASHVDDDISEPIPELKLDDEDEDDFNDFEKAIPIHRTVEIQSFDSMPAMKEVPTSEVHFEADFSNFNAFDSNPEALDDAFEDFQGFKEESAIPTSEDFTKANDDDDFDDFSDFAQAPAPKTVYSAHVEQPAIVFVKPSNVIGLLDMMFPQVSAATQETAENESPKDQQIIRNNEFVKNLNDFDTTLALVYQYSSSKTSQTLVKALGIDTRNILLGPQWNSASSMPRFAANLSFNPIEPLKPSSQNASSFKSSADSNASVLQPAKVDTVPEADFDWNSAGLVNPLDGPQSKSEPADNESSSKFTTATKPSAHPFENEPSLYGVDQETTQILEAEGKFHTGNKSELKDDVPAHQHHIAAANSNNMLVRERTIKLPETHIFTPIKGTSPVAREVVSPSPSDDPYYTKGSIVVKEYHDVEYSLDPEPVKKVELESENDFDEFQSAPPVVVLSKVEPRVKMNLLEPQKVDSSSLEIKWPEPGNVAQTISNELDFLGSPVQKTPAPVINLQLAPPPGSSKKKEIEFSKRITGTAPTEQNGLDDDEFTDFQAAPPQQSVMKPQTNIMENPFDTPKVCKKPPSNDPITLSPARLQATAKKQQENNQKSTWISSFDDEEINRITAAFPTCKTVNKQQQHQQKTNDEDDWTDFVSVTQASTISSNSLSNTTRLPNGEGDDWSDFVSVPPQKIQSAKSSSGASQFSSKPNFSSWNQPISKPYVHHATSFLSHEPRSSMNHQFTSSNFPYVTDKMPSMNITNNFNYNYSQSTQQAMGAAFGHHSAKPNSVSTILPELDFAIPKNLINLPHGTNRDPGKK